MGLDPAEEKDLHKLGHELLATAQWDASDEIAALLENYLKVRSAGSPAEIDGAARLLEKRLELEKASHRSNQRAVAFRIASVLILIVTLLFIALAGLAVAGPFVKQIFGLSKHPAVAMRRDPITSTPSPWPSWQQAVLPTDPKKAKSPLAALPEGSASSPVGYASNPGKPVEYATPPSSQSPNEIHVATRKPSPAACAQCLLHEAGSTVTHSLYGVSRVAGGAIGGVLALPGDLAASLSESGCTTDPDLTFGEPQQQNSC